MTHSIDLLDENENEKESPYYKIQSVDRTLQILKCFIQEKRALGVSEIARMLGLNRSAVHRFLLTLKDHGFVEQLKDSDRYLIGPTAFELGSVYTNSTDLSVEGRKVLADLVQQTGYLAHLAILDRDSVLYLINVEPDHRQYLFGAVGQRRVIYNTGLGKCLTAWLPEAQIRSIMKECRFEKVTPHTIGSLDEFLQELERVRQQGFAVDNQEAQIGSQCVAAPILGHRGDVVAAISVSGFGISDAKLQELSLSIRISAAQLSRRMGYSGH
ncbi:IclR family transcriptional regulator [Paenibacillus koleovorans]|uniref:IclR family transcriptional regulator n=1 Tax=Paenibacillus koleovorans TaxID=121608 RepID=UPI000FDB184B|nr:IclR family transcriptional regulator [Paenibacillus koleovorans]